MSTFKRKNPLVRAPIMRKGGVHEKTRSAKRQKAKRALRKKVNQYMAPKRGHSYMKFLEFP